MEPCRWRGRVPCSATIGQVKPNRAGSNLPRDQCRCPVPPAMTHGGGSWRSGSAATGLPWSGCHAIFFICTHCDRGHRYCNANAAKQARRQQQRRANQRHQNSPKGGSIIATASRRTDAACAKGTARDGSRFPFDRFPGIIRLWMDRCGRISSGAAVRAEIQPSLWPRCRICGRTGRFIDPFPRIPRRR